MYMPVLKNKATTMFPQKKTFLVLQLQRLNLKIQEFIIMKYKKIPLFPWIANI